MKKKIMIIISLMLAYSTGMFARNNIYNKTFLREFVNKTNQTFEFVNTEVPSTEANHKVAVPPTPSTPIIKDYFFVPWRISKTKVPGQVGNYINITILGHSSMPRRTSPGQQGAPQNIEFKIQEDNKMILVNETVAIAGLPNNIRVIIAPATLAIATKANQKVISGYSGRYKMILETIN